MSKIGLPPIDIEFDNFHPEGLSFQDLIGLTVKMDQHWQETINRILNGEDVHSGRQIDEKWLTDGHFREACDKLGLTYSFEEDDLKKAYRATIMKCHPDHGGTKEQFIEVQQAYELLVECAEICRKV